MGELLRGGAFERVLQLHQRLGGEEGQAPSGACSETKGLRLGTMEEAVAVRHSRAVQRLSSATRRAESRPSRIGPISSDVKQMGARNAGNPHVACDVEGAGDVVWVGTPGPHRRASPHANRGCDFSNSLAQVVAELRLRNAWTGY